MRIAAIIFGILGALAAAFLGANWISQARENADLIRLEKGLSKELGVGAAQVKELDDTIMASYVLLGSAGLGVAGAAAALKGKGKAAAALMLVGAVAPAVLAPKALVFTSVLLVGALLGFFVKSLPAPAARRIAAA